MAQSTFCLCSGMKRLRSTSLVLPHMNASHRAQIPLYHQGRHLSGACARFQTRPFSPTTRTTSTKTPKSHENESVLHLLLRFTSGFCLAVLVVPVYVVDFVYTDGPSMTPTILPHGEIILVDKWTHRWRGLEDGEVDGDLGEVRARTFRQVQRRQRQEQRRVKQNKKEENYRKDQNEDTLWHRCTTGLSKGDVVVVQHPQKDHTTVCKRILALPGDVVYLRGNYSTYGFPSAYWNRRQHGWERSGRSLVVPDGHVWLEGDNAENSTDSRSYGPVPAALVLGRVVMRVWPLRQDRGYFMGRRREEEEGASYKMGTTRSLILPAGCQEYDEEDELYWDEDDSNENNRSIE